MAVDDKIRIAEKKQPCTSCNKFKSGRPNMATAILNTKLICALCLKREKAILNSKAIDNKLRCYRCKCLLQENDSN